MELAASVRLSTGVNPWVGCVIVSEDGRIVGEGATQPAGGEHAEVMALAQAGEQARGATAVVTLEPCSHTGRTGPCATALIDAGLCRVIIGHTDPDPRVSGRGIAALRAAGIEVDFEDMDGAVGDQLAPYLHQRSTGRPLVILKMAATLDGRTAAADGSSKWITGEAARKDVARLRAESNAIIVGAGTVRKDDPQLTARTDPPTQRQPERIVLGDIVPGAKVLPARSYSGDLGDLLDELGEAGMVQVLVEGGSRVAHSFVSQSLVDRVVLYLAPAIMGGDDGVPLLQGDGALTIDAVKRGRFISAKRVGDDLRLEVAL